MSGNPNRGMTRRALVLAVLLSAALGGPRPAVAVQVGNGDPASCTEAAFNTAFAMGGTVTFSCGPDPWTIVFTTAKVVTGTITIDGGNLIALDGGGPGVDAVRPFTVNAGGSLTLQ